MLRKHQNYNRLHDGPVPDAAAALEADGHVLLRQVFDLDGVIALREEILDVFEGTPPDRRASCLAPPRADMFRYELFNRSPLAQAALANPRVLEAVEPLLGGDCHVISHTAWHNPPDKGIDPDGQQWHVDGGPHVVRPPDVEWPDAIPYPVFVITSQLYLEPVRLADGPTAILCGSHRSGTLPPDERKWDLELRYDDREPAVHLADAGDVTLFVSDTWHRRLPQEEGTHGRFFVQAAYARREIAPRVVPPDRYSAANEAARARATTERERQLIGLHEQCFYDG